jgi:hypothetical protein
MDGMGALGSLQLFQRHELVSLSASDQDGCVRPAALCGRYCTHIGGGGGRFLESGGHGTDRG